MTADGSDAGDRVHGTRRLVPEELVRDGFRDLLDSLLDVLEEIVQVLVKQFGDVAVLQR